MKCFLASLSLLLLASPSLALSCLPHDLARTFTEASQSEETYIVVHGELSFDEGKLPKVDWDRQHEVPPETLIPARITGKSLSLKGFETGFDSDITLNAQCFGPWCAAAATDTLYLAFLQHTPSGYVLAVTPCGGFGFADPDKRMLGKVARCFRGKPCDPEPSN